MSLTLRNLSSGPCGWKARPAEPDQQLEASPARGAGNPHREAWTASPKARLWSAERPFVGALAFVIPGAALRYRTGLVSAVLPASTEQGERTFGGPQGPGRSCRLLGEIPDGETGSTTPGLDGALVRRGAKRTSGRGGTAQRRRRSAAGRAAGSRSALRVPSKRGNSPRRTPWREARRQPAGSTEGNRPNPSRFDPPVHGTRTARHGDPSGVANRSAEEPYARM